MKLKNSNRDETQTQIVMKLKNANCGETKISNCDKTKKNQMVPKLKKIKL